jgi:uncharacterized SAM-binding protein YcdF (DUF218 family)
VAVVAVGALYVAVTFFQVWSASNEDEAQPADAVIVLGAAQYDGRPSPVLQARLDHAAELYKAGTVGKVIVTGGNQAGDRVTEAFSGFEYLRNEGIPEDDILLEVDGGSTYEQLAASEVIMDDHGLTDAVLVSDPYHSFRLQGIADEVGIDARVSPTDTGASLTSLVRETAAVSLGRLVGYRRLENRL